jgi:hypothetical protein
VRGPVIGSAVGLDFDDPSGPSPHGVLADEDRAEQRPGGPLGRAFERRAQTGDPARAQWVITRPTLSGMNQPKIVAKAGMSQSRYTWAAIESS